MKCQTLVSINGKLIAKKAHLVKERQKTRFLEADLHAMPNPFD